jgi:hypothetical protein
MDHRLCHESIINIGDAFAFIRARLLPFSAFSNQTFGIRTTDADDTRKPATFYAFHRRAVRLVERVGSKTSTTCERTSAFSAE